jgi:hypothetical protein
MALGDFYGGGGDTPTPMANFPMALEMLRNPRAFVQYLASQGHEPPGDFDEENIPSRNTAGQHLASANSEKLMGSLAYATPEQLTGGGGTVLDTGSSPGEPPGWGAEQGRNALTAIRRALTGPGPTPQEDMTTPEGSFPSEQGPEQAPPWQGPEQEATWQGPKQEPTPAGEAPSTGAPPAGDTSKKPGGEKPGEGPLEGFSKVLAALKPPPGLPPIHVSTPPPPHPIGGQKTNFAPLLQGMLAMRQPPQILRLGEALGGRRMA